MFCYLKKSWLYDTIKEEQLVLLVRSYTITESIPANSRIMTVINEVCRCRTEVVTLSLIRRLSETIHVFDESFANYKK